MRSIRKRILRPVIPLTAAALLLTGIGIKEGVRTGIERALDEQLAVMGRVVGASVDVGVEGEVTFEEAEVEFALRVAGVPRGKGSRAHALYEVRDESGRLVASSRRQPLEAIPVAETVPKFFSRTIDGRGFRLCLLSVTREPESYDRQRWLEAHPGMLVPEPKQMHFAVVMGLDTREVEGTLALFRTRLLAGFGVLFLGLIFLPSWIVGRALRPLERLSSEAETVGPESPGARLGEEGVDREVHALVSAFNRALDRLRQGLEMEKRFTADAAHELRTPLAAIRAQCEVALRRPRKTAELRATLEAVYGACLRMGTTVEGLLALAKFQQVSSEAVSVRVDLARVADEAVRLHEAAARAKGVELSANFLSVVPVLGDEALLLACLSKFVENAIRYTPSGGRVRVLGGADPTPWAAVEDTGIGIPDEQLERIFERFYRVDPARSRADGGSGLGLAIAGEIARVHGAKIQVQSRLGEGSRFEIRFPTAAEPQEG